MSRRLDRTVPPQVAPLAYQPLPPYKKVALANGIPVYLLRYGTQEVVEVQVVYKAGHSYEAQPGLADYATRMLTEGTEKKSSLQIAQMLDDFGSYLNVESGFDLATVSLSTLERHLPLTLNLLKEVLLQSTVPEDEFTKARNRNLQKLEIEEQKTQFQARKLFRPKLFGQAHPYAYVAQAQQLKAITPEACREYIGTMLHPSRATIIVTGLFDEDDVFNLLNSKLGKLEASAAADIPSAAASTAISTAAAGRYVHSMADTVQSTLSVGHAAFSRAHEDYHKMRLVNTVLGGYFGSRLMSNIREEKGYTYGIYSQWSSLKYGGYFGVNTSVGNEFVEDTLSEIKKEIIRLQEEPIGAEELEVAKNYLLGRIISQQETPFEIGDILKLLLHHELEPEDIQKGYEAIQACTTEEIQTLAQQHLQPHALIEVVAGVG